jgi:hypothetical protein
MSSPGREAPPEIHHFSAATCSAEWTKEFKALPREPGSSFIHGLEFCKSAKKLKYDMHEVETLSGKHACQQDTIKQWDTTIKEAKALDNVPNVLKAAQFHYFDHMAKHPEPENPAPTWGGNHLVSGNDLDHQLAAGSQVPLEQYAKTRHQELRQKNRRRNERKSTSRAQYHEQQHFQQSSAGLGAAHSPDRSFENFNNSIYQVYSSIRLNYGYTANKTHERLRQNLDFLWQKITISGFSISTQLTDILKSPNSHHVSLLMLSSCWKRYVNIILQPLYQMICVVHLLLYLFGAVKRRIKSLRFLQVTRF